MLIFQNTFDKNEYLRLKTHNNLCILFSGRVGLTAGQAGSQGDVPLLAGGGARQEPQAEQAHPPQPP